MCGLTVAVFRDGARDTSAAISKMEKSLRNISHRGPDASKVTSYGAVTLGHCRLSIIDLAERSNQPMSDVDGRYHIVFNGEIYNYREIKSSINDWEFQTSSDTEVILAAYKEWGNSCFSRFIGQFAVCIFDRIENKITVARDMMGEKPLYIHANSDGVFFSSEIRGLLPFLIERPTINASAFNDYLHYQYIPEPESIIDNVSKVTPGEIVSLDVVKLEMTKNTFWNWYAPKIDERRVTIQDIEQQLKSAVNYSLVADVPVALGLSAGLDSAAIAVFAKQAGVELSTYTIGYPNKPEYDERDAAGMLATHLGLKNVQVEIDPDNFTDNFENYCNALSEPIADTAGYGHYLVPKTIGEYGHKVMLSGIGGDELFWGYEWTRFAIQYERQVKFNTPSLVVDLLRSTPRILKLIFMMSRSRKVPAKLKPYFRLLYTMLVRTTPKDQTMFMGISGAPEFTTQIDVGCGFFPETERMSDLKSVYRHTENITAAATKTDFIVELLSKLNRTWLISNCVQLADTVSMANSIESRSPFLNPNLIKTMLSYNIQHETDVRVSKSVLRKILANKLPKELLNRPKSGFVTPVAKWVDLLEQKYADAVDDGVLVEQGLINKGFFNLKEFRNVTLHTKYRLILLEKWYSNLINKYL